MEQQRLPLLASLMGLGAGVVWSFGGITSRLADRSDAFQYMVWRSIGVIVVIEIMFAMKRTPWPTYRAWTSGNTMRLANFGLFLASIAFVYAVKTTTPATAAFLGSLTPLVAVAFSRFLGERLSRSTIVALVVALVGLVLTVVGDLDAGNMVGNISALLACVGFAIYTVCLRTDTTRDWSPVLSGYALMMIVVCTTVVLIEGKPLVPPIGDIGWALLHGAVFIVLGTVLFNAASKQVPAVPMTVFAQTEMVFVPIWAFLILDMTPQPLSILGGVVIFCAVVGKAIFDARAEQRSEFTTAPAEPLL
jgi:drug/metabolite transporter (DMT)-like permease